MFIPNTILLPLGLLSFLNSFTNALLQAINFEFVALFNPHFESVSYMFLHGLYICESFQDKILST